MEELLHKIKILEEENNKLKIELTVLLYIILVIYNNNNIYVSRTYFCSFFYCSYN